MYINITDSETGNNKASCGQLVQYLEKENRVPSEDGSELELWFSTGRCDIIPQEVRVNIDNNIAKLGKYDAKFFLININPSEKEIKYLKEKFGEQGAADQLKEFASNVMDLYARNFKRPGIESNSDLLWYGKLEYHRYYGHTDTEVKQGLVKEGQRKEGEQMHVQVIVSRKDMTNKIKLSPMNNSRGSNIQHSAKLGQFDRTSFKGSGESLFDAMFDFGRELKDTMNYTLIMKNGTAEQKQQMQIASKNHMNENMEPQFEPISDISEDNWQGLEQLLATDSSLASGLLNILLPDFYNEEQTENIISEIRNKKRKRRPLG